MEAWEIANSKQVQIEDNRLYLEIPQYDITAEKPPESDTVRSVIILDNEEPAEPYMGIYDMVL